MSLPLDDRLLGAIEEIGPTRWSGLTCRHTAPGRDALSGMGALLFGGRWNPPNLVPTLYLADTEQTCRAEFVRMAQGQGNGVSSFLPRDLHQIDVTDVALVDLSTPAQLEQVGLRVHEVAQDDWAPCQRVGGAVHLLGHAGLLAPSATGLGHVVCLFEGRAKARVKLVETRPLSASSRKGVSET